MTDARRLVLAVLHPFAARDMAFLVDALSPAYEVQIADPSDLKSADALVRDADVAIASQFRPGALTGGHRLRLLQMPSAGADGVDVRALDRHGVAVAGTHSHAPLVAEHALAMALALIKKVSLHDRLVRAGRRFRPTGAVEDADMVSDTLIGARVGLIGFGVIGRALAGLLAGFDVRPVAHVRHSDRHAANGIATVTLDEVLRDAEIVFVTLPLTTETRGLLGEHAFAAINPNVYLVSTSRPEVIDRGTLLRALRTRRIRGAAFDGWYGDDTDDGAGPFSTLDNVVLSPHRAGTHRDRAPYLRGVVDNLLAFARTGEIRDRVDPEEGY